MAVNQHHEGFSLGVPRTRWQRFLGLPVWYIQWRLRLARRAIAFVETQLNAEFGLEETRPLHAELACLRAERDRLVGMLSDSR